MNSKPKVYRLWKPIEFTSNWKECDTSIIDDVAASWFKRRAVLEANSVEYSEFLNQLKRQHAIETGIIERLYDLKKGITETFIKEGFVQSYLSHGDSNIPQNQLMAHLNDHLESVDLIFDVVKENRPLTTGFIKEINHLVTRSQKFAEGRDQFGNKTKIPLLKGSYKIRENNPTRDDGTKVLYCPPEQVSSEMDNLVNIFNGKVEKEEHSLIVSAWFHHAFTIIHPFQDGNGRVARLITSLISIKDGYFPFTVLREEAKEKYIEALEHADEGLPQKLVNYFGEVQKRNIQKALNIKEIKSSSFEEVQQIFIDKVENWKSVKGEAYQDLLRMQVFKYCSEVLYQLKKNLENQLTGNANITIESCSFKNEKKQHLYYSQIASYANKHDYFFNRTLPKAWLTFRIKLSENKKYQLGISIHHYGYNDTTLALGPFLEFKATEDDEKRDTTLPLEINPHIISIDDSFEGKKKNIRLYLENAIALMMAQIASELVPNTNRTYDAFLSYNSKDKKEVIIIAQLLANEGIKTWFDAWNVLAGDPWQEKLENALDDSKAVVVLIGSEGIGPWQNEEIRVAIDEWVTKRSIRVIPVLLPNAVGIPKFLKNLSWAVYKDNIYEDNTLSHIIRSIRGERVSTVAQIIKSPYRGLEVFKEEHQNLFFGREDEVAQIVQHLAQHHFMVVIGVSGSGKSSMVQAGVIPKLRKQGNIKAVLFIKPGEKPVEELATAIFHSLKENEKSNEQAKEEIINLIPLLIENKETLHLKARQLCPKEEDKILLVVDQFEELFLLTKRGEQRDAFIELLLYAIAGKKTQIIITMRSDFIGKIGEFPSLNQIVTQNLIQIGAMEEEKLNDIVVKPALTAGIIFEKGLEQRILFEVKNSSGKLPLIEFTLDQLFKNKNGNRFEHAVYEKIGGVTGALSQHAEEQYDKLDNEEKALLRKMFTYFFIYPGEDFEDAKRRVNKTNLLSIDSKAENVIQTFLNARLLSTTEDKEKSITYVEVAHEALINNWGRIQEWITDERGNNRIYNNLKSEANAYAANKDKSLLYTGNALTRIEEFFINNKEIFNEVEAQFVIDSITQRQKAINRTRWVIASIISILTIALLISLYFFRGAKEANKETQKQLANNYFQQASKEDDSNLKMHKLAIALYTNPENNDFNRRIKSQYLKPSIVQKNVLWFNDNGIPGGAFFNKNEDQILSWDDNRTIKIWDAQTGEQIGIKMLHNGYPFGAVYNKNEDRILSWNRDGSIKLWDVQTKEQMGKTIKHDRVNEAIYNKNEDQVLSWSSDAVKLWDIKTGEQIGSTMKHLKSVEGVVYIKNKDQVLTWSSEGTIKLWDAKTGEQKGSSIQHGSSIRGALINKNEDQILSWSRDGIKLWDVQTKEQKGNTMKHNRIIEAVYNKNEDRILSWSGAGTIKLWNAQTGEQKGKTMQHNELVEEVIYSKNEDQILSWSEDGTIKLWEAQTGEQKGKTMQHDELVEGVVFNENEDQILSWSRDGTIKLWDAKTGEQTGNTMQHHHFVLGAIYSKNEDRILSWSRDGTIKLWYVQIEEQKGKTMKHDDFVYGAVFNKNEGQILSWSEDGSIKLWDVQTEEQKGKTMEHDDFVYGAVFNKNEDRILSWSEDKTIKLWNVQTGEQKGKTMRHDDFVYGAVFNKNEDRILSWSEDGTVKLWDAKTGKQKNKTMQHYGWISGAVFSKNEDRILSWSEDGTIKLWDVQTGEQKNKTMQHDDLVYGAVFNKNEDQILSWSRDGEIRLWDIQTGEQKNKTMQHNDLVYGAVFNKNEDQILSWSRDGEIRLWDVQSGERKIKIIQHQNSIRETFSNLVFNKNENRILSWSEDGNIKMWDIQTGEQNGKTMQHEGQLLGAVYDKNEDRILSWSNDGTIKLWDAQTGEQIGNTMTHTGIINAVFDREEQRILSWSDDGTIKFWNIPGDLDLPKDDFLLQTQVTTSTNYNEKTGALEVIPPAEWQEKKKAWLKKAKAHAKKCQYPRQNVFINYYATEQDSVELGLKKVR